MSDKFPGLARLYKINGASTKASAHHPRSSHTFELRGLRYEKIQLVTAYLIQSRQAFMGIKHSFSERLKIFFVEIGTGLLYAGDFLYDIQAPLRHKRRQFIVVFFEHIL